MELIPARVLEVVDGDTLDVELRLGFGLLLHQRVRLLGLNCPERGTEAGGTAEAFTRDWVERAEGAVSVETDERREKYGRLLARVYSGSMTCLNDDLLTQGHAAPYDGAGPREGARK
ncbi:hypothetical protein GCM10020367_20760 [Streptomyces sannanensis]|uniref:TNase-like domain-containing protein n=1 Tax=Streptomyces sannanensis TaxID=285536 RepID=A0ABP6S981_9ACTN